MPASVTPGGPGSPADPSESVDSLSGCLLVVFARIGGFTILVGLALFIVRREPWRLSLLDVAYGSVVVAILLAHRHLRGSTRSSAIVLGATLLAWAIVNSIDLP